MYEKSSYPTYISHYFYQRAPYQSQFRLFSHFCHFCVSRVYSQPLVGNPLLNSNYNTLPTILTITKWFNFISTSKTFYQIINYFEFQSKFPQAKCMQCLNVSTACDKVENFYWIRHISTNNDFYMQAREKNSSLFIIPFMTWKVVRWAMWEG